MLVSPFCFFGCQPFMSRYIGTHKDMGSLNMLGSSPTLCGRKTYQLISPILENSIMSEIPLQHLQEFLYCANCLAYLSLAIIFLSKVLDREGDGGRLERVRGKQVFIST